MEHTLEVGKKQVKEITVNEENTANAMRSGSLPVFATPAMAALMESAAVDCVQSGLPDGATTVGISLQISHIAATPLREKVTACAELTKIDGRKLTFHVFADDEHERIGEGTHIRFIVDKEKFMRKARRK